LSFRLDPREALAADLERSAREQLEHALGELGDAERDRHAAIHAARKSCKRLRALLRLAREGRLVGGLAARRRGELRAAIRPLGQRLFAEPPAALARRFEAHWQATRGGIEDGGALEAA
jgi:hypothetical protein